MMHCTVLCKVSSGSELTFDAEVDGVAGGLALAVLRPAGVGSVVFLLHPLQVRIMKRRLIFCSSQLSL